MEVELKMKPTRSGDESYAMALVLAAVTVVWTGTVWLAATFLIERFFNKIKQCRRVATRYDKLAANYLAFVKLASIRIWLRANESMPLASCNRRFRVL